MLSSKQALQAYIVADDLADYAREVEKAVDAFFTCLEPRINRGLAIQIELTTKGPSVRFVATPELDRKLRGELRERLESVRAPKVGGPVKFDLIFKIWGIANKQ